MFSAGSMSNPLSPDPNPVTTRYGSVPPMNLIAAGLAVVLYQVAAALLFGFFAIPGSVSEMSYRREQLLLLPAYTIATVGVLALYLRSVPRPAGRFFMPSGRAVGASVAALGALLSALVAAVPAADAPTADLLRVTYAGPWWELVAVLALLPVLTEEVVLRGIVQPGLAARYSAPLAIAVTAVLYAVGFGGPGRIVFGLVVGMIASVATHAAAGFFPAGVTRFAASIAAILARDGRLDTALQEHGVALGSAGLLLLAAGVFLLRRTPAPDD